MRQSPVRFDERLEGCLTMGDPDHERGFRKARAVRRTFTLELRVEIDDVAAFLADHRHTAAVRGTLRGEPFGEPCDVRGTVAVLIPDESSTRVRQMRYEIELPPWHGEQRLIGVKSISDQPGMDAWRDTTTLFVQLERRPAGTWFVAGAGKAVLENGAVLRMMRSLFAHALAPDPVSRVRRLAATLRYARFFTAALWGIYATPKIASLRRPRRFERKPREIPMFTLDGVGDADVTTHYVRTADGLTLPMLRIRARGATEDGAIGDSVLLLHGLTSSSDMFIMPEHRNLVRHLHQNGFRDVWCFDFRMSCRNPHNLRRHRDTMDDVALFDHPAAVECIRREIGPHAKLHVVAHCLGSLTFMMSLFAGTAKDIASVVSNSVSLAVRVPWWSRVKLALAPFLVETVCGIPYASPVWRDDPGLTIGELVARFITFVHRECDEPACHMLSMMWGAGCPALFEHRNLDPRTHARLRDLFGGTGLHYYRHVHEMVRHGGAVKYTPSRDALAALPDDYLERAKRITTPILFLTGDCNNVFADSNPASYERLCTLDPQGAPRRHDLRVLRGYGHQDVFMGRNSADDVFPHVVAFLRRHGGTPAPADGGTKP